MRRKRLSPASRSRPGSGRHCRGELADKRWGLAHGNLRGGLLSAARGRAVDVEEVADALERPDPARLTRGCAELAPDAAHPDAQVLEIVAVLRAPDLGQELRVQDDLAGVRGEVLEEQPLGARQ